MIYSIFSRPPILLLNQSFVLDYKRQMKSLFSPSGKSQSHLCPKTERAPSSQGLIKVKAAFHLEPYLLVSITTGLGISTGDEALQCGKLGLRDDPRSSY
jgi:hypothetical protein